MYKKVHEYSSVNYYLSMLYMMCETETNFDQFWHLVSSSHKLESCVETQTLVILLARMFE